MDKFGLQSNHYLGWRIMVDDRAFTRRRVMKFKYPWYYKAVFWFRKYKYVTGSIVQWRNAYIINGNRLIVPARFLEDIKSNLAPINKVLGE